MRRALTLVTVLWLAGCATDPDETPGFADVQGQVFLKSGLPMPYPVVSVDGLESRALPIAQGDSVGRYHLTLRSTVGRHPCYFFASDAGSARIQLDTALTFAPAGLHPIQTVDLHQTP